MVLISAAPGAMKRAPDFASAANGDQREVELVRLEQRHVLGAALGIACLDAKARLLRVDDLGKGVAEHREAAAGGRGTQDQHEDQLHLTAAEFWRARRSSGRRRSRCARTWRNPRSSSARAGCRAWRTAP